ncbi:prepilin-type N-terminal cleavage/methylation domain-containing protein [Craterilacuibacter sp.]|uniref:prepilin-type N-terminal cleavage/methylation domain-containing protein n=1 Tax=Craterilacuibacter sp. TaxID=2870909 RepID=UPI003F2C50E8
MPLSRMHGFTLIEVMVVLVIVGVLASMVTLSLTPDTHRVMGDEAVRLSRVIEQAADAAEMGDPLVLVWTRTGYGFRRQADDGRFVDTGEDFFAEHRWPDGIVSGGARIDGAPVTPGEVLPLWQDGRASELLLAVEAGGRRVEVSLSALGFARVEDMSPEAAP